MFAHIPDHKIFHISESLSLPSHLYASSSVFSGQGKISVRVSFVHQALVLASLM